MIIILTQMLLVQVLRGEKINKSFDLERGKEVTLDFNDIDGNVLIESHDKNTITFQFEKWNKGKMSKKVEKYTGEEW